MYLSTLISLNRFRSLVYFLLLEYSIWILVQSVWVLWLIVFVHSLPASFFSSFPFSTFLNTLVQNFRHSFFFSAFFLLWLLWLVFFVWVFLISEFLLFLLSSPLVLWISFLTLLYYESIFSCILWVSLMFVLSLQAFNRFLPHGDLLLEN